MAETRFFSRTYDEAMQLLVAARAYLSAVAGEGGGGGTAPAGSLRFHCEALRVTARLAHIMAWLLAQRAVQAGEISAAEAAARYRLSEADAILLEGGGGAADDLPPRLCELLAASRQLYIRVTRLDTLVRRAAGV